MPKNYFSRNERVAVGLLSQAIGGMKDVYTERGNESKYLKLCTTYFDKYLVEMFGRVGTNAGKKLLNDFNDCEIWYKMKGVFTDHDSLNKFELDQERMYDLAEGVIEGFCKKCKREGDAVINCSIKEMFIYAGVPEAYPEGDCPYKE